MAVWLVGCVQLGFGQDGTVTRSSGGSIQTTLNKPFVINKESSLEREWVTIHDPSVPADLEFEGSNTVGVTTISESGSYSGTYSFRSDLTIVASEDLSAVEVVFVTFDLWGRHKRTLSFTTIAEIPTGDSKTTDPRWHLLSASECSEFYASIAYIERVRTTDGRVFEIDRRLVVDEALKFDETFTEDDLAPKYKAPPPRRG